MEVVAHLEKLVRKTPLDIVARAVLLFGELSGPAGELFGAYDEFLALLDDTRRREHLEKIPPGGEADAEFRAARVMTKRFQRALAKMFFDTPPLAELTKRYGVF